MCFICQKFWHHQANFKAKAKCGVCSKAYETEVCIKAHKDGQRDTIAKCLNCAKRHRAWSLACSARMQALLKRQEQAKKCPDFVPPPPGTYVWGQNKTPRPPKRKKTPPQPKPDTSNTEELPRVASGRKKNQRKKDSQVDENLFFDEKDMTPVECCSFCSSNSLVEDQWGGREGNDSNDSDCCSPEGEEAGSIQTKSEPRSSPSYHHKTML